MDGSVCRPSMRRSWGGAGVGGHGIRIVIETIVDVSNGPNWLFRSTSVLLALSLIG